LKERERGNRGVQFGKGGKGRGIGKIAISFLPLESEQREGGSWRGCGRPAQNPGEPGHGGGRVVVQNEEDSTSVRFPYLSRVVVARGGGFLDGDGLEG
jgi:hypothetical protein